MRVIPIGAKETGDFLRKVTEFTGIDKEKAEAFIKREEKLYYNYLEDFSDFYSEYWWGLPDKFGVVGDSAYNIAITKFLVNQLGLIPGKQIITENPPEEYREEIRKLYQILNHIGDISK